MVGKKSDAQAVVHETLVNGAQHRFEGNGAVETAKDFLQSLYLLRTVSQNENAVALVEEAIALLLQQVEILVKQRLRHGVELDGVL